MTVLPEDCRGQRQPEFRSVAKRQGQSQVADRAVGLIGLHPSGRRHGPITRRPGRQFHDLLAGVGRFRPAAKRHVGIGHRAPRLPWQVPLLRRYARCRSPPRGPKRWPRRVGSCPAATAARISLYFLAEEALSGEVSEPEVGLELPASRSRCFSASSKRPMLTRPLGQEHVENPVAAGSRLQAVFPGVDRGLPLAQFPLDFAQARDSRDNRRRQPRPLFDSLPGRLPEAS